MDDFERRRQEMDREFEAHRRQSEQEFEASRAAADNTLIVIICVVVFTLLLCFICSYCCYTCRRRNEQKPIQAAKANYIKQQQTHPQHGQFLPPPQSVVPPPLSQAAVPSQSVPPAPSMTTPYPVFPCATPYPQVQVSISQSRLEPGWNRDELQPRPQPGILVQIPSGRSERTIRAGITRVNLDPALVHHVSPPKSNAKSVRSSRERTARGSSSDSNIRSSSNTRKSDKSSHSRGSKRDKSSRSRRRNSSRKQ